jgi:hypothetical protein
VTEFPEDSPQAREGREAEDWLRRELAFLHGVERRVARRARVRAEVWRAGAVGLIFVMFASCWYLAALSSSGETGTACPVSSSSVDVDSTAPAGGSDGAAGPYGAAGSGRTASDGSAQAQGKQQVQTQSRGGAAVYAAAEPGAAAPASGTGADAAKPGEVTATGAAADPAASAPGTPTGPGTAKPAPARGPHPHPHPRPGGIPRRKAVKPQGAGGAASADPVKPAVAHPADGSSSACGV